MTTSVRLGDFCIVNRAVQLAHDCSAGDFVSMNPQACISGQVSIGAGCELGAACVVRQALTIGDGAMIGMGAVVVKDVEPNTVVVGNPARPIKTLPAW